jgi:hypothetical protein
MGDIEASKPWLFFQSLPGRKGSLSVSNQVGESLSLRRLFPATIDPSSLLPESLENDDEKPSDCIDDLADSNGGSGRGPLQSG